MKRYGFCLFGLWDIENSASAQPCVLSLERLKDELKRLCGFSLFLFLGNYQNSEHVVQWLLCFSCLWSVQNRPAHWPMCSFSFFVGKYPNHRLSIICLFSLCLSNFQNIDIVAPWVLSLLPLEGSKVFRERVMSSFSLFVDKYPKT